jgi:hypothetical protein
MVKLFDAGAPGLDDARRAAARLRLASVPLEVARIAGPESVSDGPSDTISGLPFAMISLREWLMRVHRDPSAM